MTSTNNYTVMGLFKTRDSAECAYGALSDRGYDTDMTDVMMSDDTRNRYYADGGETELGSKAAEGTGTGAALGGTLGAIIGAIAAIGTSVVLPGIGLVIAGPLAAAFAGAGAGGIAGGLIGALVGSGIPEEHAAAYETGIKSGGIVLRANPQTAEDAAYIESKWKACGGEQIYSNAAQKTVATTTNTAATAVNATDNVTIPVIEENLQVGKRAVETGGARVETHITERPVEETVTLRDEKVHVDRRPADRPVREGDLDAIREGNFVVTEREEQAVVAKEANVVGEVVIGKNVTERTETIRDTVKRTDVDVEDLTDRDR